MRSARTTHSGERWQVKQESHNGWILYVFAFPLFTLAFIGLLVCNDIAFRAKQVASYFTL